MKKKIILLACISIFITQIFAVDIYLSISGDDKKYMETVEKTVYEKLSECNNKEFSFFLNPKERDERKYPNIELKFGSMIGDQTSLEYVINYSEDVNRVFKGFFNKNIYNEKNQGNVSYVSDFCVKIINSALPYINANKKTATKNNDAFLIDTIYVRKYLGREVEELPNTNTAGMDVVVNNDNSFYLKADDKLRLYDANGNIKFDFTQTLIDIGIDKADHRNLYIKEIDSKLYVFKLRDYLNAYVFDGTKYLGKKRFYCSDANSLTFEKYVSAVGYPVFSKYDDRSLIVAGTEIGSEKIYDFIKIKRTSTTKILKNGDLIFSLGNLLTIFDEKGNVKKCITIDIDDTQSTAISYINDEILVIPDNAENCYLVFSLEGDFLYSIPVSILTASELVAYKNGIFYFTSYWSGGNTLCRVGGKNFSGPSYLKEISDVNKKIASNPYNHKLYKRLYNLYMTNGGTYLAYNALEKYLELSPVDSKANEQKLKLELLLQKKAIKEDVQNVIKVYDELGEISATQDFLTVATKIEKLLKQFPNDKTLKSQYAELLEMFGKTSTAIQNNTDDLSIEEINLVALFPALKNVYATNPCGTIKLKNISGKPISNITVTSKLRKYMDYDVTSKVVKKLEKGKSCDIDLLIPLNDEALNVQENTNVQIQYTINWECDGKKKKLNVTRPITIYKKSAMCWNDAAMLSCFILPNDNTVTDFSMSMLKIKDKNEVLNNNINIAATLIDGMGMIPLTYVSDPDVSFSNIVDNAYAVDTVRFPNETLAIKGGDCDDMTTLICSVLESVGISTAIITIPGHILAAFDAGEKSNFIWQALNKEGKLITIDYNGKVFVPIETTVMDKGFMECWKSASKQLANKDNIEDFIVINEKRNVYPPVAVESGKTKTDVDVAKVVSQKRKDMTEAKKFFEIRLAKISEKTNNGADLNTIAKMYYSIGNDDLAIDTLLKSIRVDKTYLPSYNNLAALYKLQGKDDMASKILASKPEEEAADKKTKTFNKARASNKTKEQ